MALLAPGALPRKGQSCRIDGQLAIHTGAGEYHLINVRGETVMKEGRTFTLVTRARMNQYLTLAATLEGGVDANVRPAEDPADSWISGTIANLLHTSGILVHVLPSSAVIELLGREGPGGLGQRMGGNAEVEFISGSGPEA
jgi:hypothetical protein